jgi:hypothetical protein
MVLATPRRILGPLEPTVICGAGGQRPAEHGGKNAKKRAGVVMAQKLPIGHRLWVGDKVYESLRKPPRATATAWAKDSDGRQRSSARQ